MNGNDRQFYKDAAIRRDAEESNKAFKLNDTRKKHIKTIENIIHEILNMYNEYVDNDEDKIIKLKEFYLTSCKEGHCDISLLINNYEFMLEYIPNGAFRGGVYSIVWLKDDEINSDITNVSLDVMLVFEEIYKYVRKWHNSPMNYLELDRENSEILKRYIRYN